MAEGAQRKGIAGHQQSLDALQVKSLGSQSSNEQLTDTGSNTPKDNIKRHGHEATSV